MNEPIKFDFTKRLSAKRKVEFAELLQISLAMSRRIGFKVSSRGWGYLMEQAGYINKSQFDKIEDAINDCRRKGLLPVDFVAEEKAREFSGVEKPSKGDVKDTLAWMLRDVLDGSKYFTPDWWVGEKYYIQLVVEKIDLVTLFEPVCSEYHIPIANAKGWSSILQRAEYARRFKSAEDMGLQPVLLYCGDHDPDGLRISDTLRKNLEQVSEVLWSDGKIGYNPAGLIIDRIGLNYDFIIDNGYTWIDNLITGSAKDLASPNHPNFKLPYVQQYLKTIGERKCEANAIVTTPEPAEKLIRGAIEHYVGSGALFRFQEKRLDVQRRYYDVLRETGLEGPINNVLEGRNFDENDEDE